MGSQALDLTHSWGSLRPLFEEVFKRRISRLSRTRRLYWRLDFDLSLKVARILGFSQSMDPVVHWRACFEIPEIFILFIRVYIILVLGHAGFKINTGLSYILFVLVTIARLEVYTFLIIRIRLAFVCTAENVP